MVCQLSGNSLSNEKWSRRWRKKYIDVAKQAERIRKANEGCKLTSKEKKPKKGRKNKAKFGWMFKLTGSRQKLQVQLKYQQKKETSDTRHEYSTPFTQYFERKS